MRIFFVSIDHDKCKVKKPPRFLHRRVANFLKRSLTAFSIFTLVFTYTFGLYANKFILVVADGMVRMRLVCTPTSSS